MMRFRFVMLCLLGAWLITPIVVGNTNRLPHEHMFLGQVTKAQFDEHLAEEADEEMARARAGGTRFESGFIVSVPFGNLGTWLTSYFVIACAGWLVVAVPHIMEQIVLMRLRALPIHLPRLDPPPRFSS